MMGVIPPTGFALGDRTLTIDAADSAGTRSTPVLQNARVVVTSDINRDRVLDDRDRIRFRRA